MFYESEIVVNGLCLELNTEMGIADSFPAPERTSQGSLLTLFTLQATLRMCVIAHFPYGIPGTAVLLGWLAQAKLGGSGTSIRPPRYL